MADQLIRTLAERTGESMAGTVKQAVRDRLQAVPPSEGEIAARRRKLAKSIVRCSAMPTVDHRTADKIIGYAQ